MQNSLLPKAVELNIVQGWSTLILEGLCLAQFNSSLPQTQSLNLEIDKWVETGVFGKGNDQAVLQDLSWVALLHICHNKQNVPFSKVKSYFKICQMFSLQLTQQIVPRNLQKFIQKTDKMCNFTRLYNSISKFQNSNQ